MGLWKVQRIANFTRHLYLSCEAVSELVSSKFSVINYTKAAKSPQDLSSTVLCIQTEQTDTESAVVN